MKRYAPRGATFLAPGEVFRPVVALDIDGTLLRYHEHFIRFAEQWLGKSLPPAEGFEGGPFHAYLGLAKSTYRKIKLAYRRGGIKRSIPAYEGASALTRDVRARGAILILATTRPYLSLENIDEDTRVCCQRNGLVFDSIIWGEDKYRQVARFGERVVSISDDEPALLERALKLGLVTNKIHRPYNQGAECDFAANGLDNLSWVISMQLNMWEKANR